MKKTNRLVYKDNVLKLILDKKDFWRQKRSEMAEMCRRYEVDLNEFELMFKVAYKTLDELLEEVEKL